MSRLSMSSKPTPLPAASASLNVRISCDKQYSAILRRLICLERCRTAAGRLLPKTGHGFVHLSSSVA